MILYYCMKGELYWRKSSCISCPYVHRFPGKRVVWPQILPRLKWRDHVKEEYDAMESCGLRLNSTCAKTVVDHEGFYIKHPEIPLPCSPMGSIYPQQSTTFFLMGYREELKIHRLDI